MIGKKLGPYNILEEIGKGGMAEEMGHLSDAENLLKENLAVARELADQELIMATLNILGTTTMRQGNTESMEYLEEALSIGRSLGDQAGIVHALMWMGTIHDILNTNYTEGMKHKQEALLMAQNMGDQRTITRINNMLGENSRRQDKYQEAREYYEKARLI